MSSSGFLRDEFVPQLLRERGADGADAPAGAPVRRLSRTCWGLNLNALSPPPQALRGALAALLADSPRCVAALVARGAYFYPPHALHVTLAGLAPFNRTPLRAPAERAACMASWRAALPAVLVRAAVPPAFPLVAERLVLERAAAFILYADPTGSVPRLRAALRECAAAARSEETHPPERAAGAGVHLPAIVHSTVMRFSRDVSGEAEVAEVRALFAELAARWQPVTVTVDGLLLVHECVPYMHLQLDVPVGDGGDADVVVARFALPPLQPP